MQLLGEEPAEMARLTIATAASEIDGVVLPGSAQAASITARRAGGVAPAPATARRIGTARPAVACRQRGSARASEVRAVIGLDEGQGQVDAGRNARRGVDAIVGDHVDGIGQQVDSPGTSVRVFRHTANVCWRGTPRVDPPRRG